MTMNTEKRNSFLQIAVRAVDEENYRITHSVNTKALDRYDTVVLPKGADTKHFVKNAVVLWAHNGDPKVDTLPIARNVSLEIKEDEIEVVTEFNRNDPFAVKVFNAYRDGFLSAWSIGFIPKKWKKVDEENVEDINSKYNLSLTRENIENAGGWGVYLIYEWELLEYSAVPVPGNPEALTKAEESSFKRELVTRGLMEEKVVNSMDIRAILAKRDEEAAVEAVPEPEPEPVAPVEPEPTPEPEAEAAVENTPEPAPEPEVEPEAEAETTPEPVEETVAVVEKPNESTQESAPSPEPVVSVAEEQPQRNYEAEITTLANENKALLERLAKLEEKFQEVQASLAVDNIDNVRALAQKKLSNNPETFFSRLLRS